MSISRKTLSAGVLVAALLATILAFPQEEKTYFNPKAKPIPTGSKIFIAAIPGGYENYIAAGILKKKVQVVLVNDRSKANTRSREFPKARRPIGRRCCLRVRPRRARRPASRSLI